MQFTVSKEEGTNLVEKEENVKKEDSNKTQPEENNTFDGKVMVTVIRISPGNLDITSLVQSSDEPDNPTLQHNILPIMKSKTIYHNPDSQSWNEALVLGTAGKSNDKNKTWFNLKYLTNNLYLRVDFSQIKGWKNTEEEVLIANSHDNIKILKAKETVKELDYS